MKFLVKFDLEFDLKFEISDGKNLVKFWARTFPPAGKQSKFRRKIRKLRFRFRDFFGNFVQQKGSAKSWYFSGQISNPIQEDSTGCLV